MDRRRKRNAADKNKVRPLPLHVVDALLRELAGSFPKQAPDPKEVERRVADILRRAEKKRRGKLDPPGSQSSEQHVD